MSQAIVELGKMSFRLSEVEFRLAYTLDTEFAVSSRMHHRHRRRLAALAITGPIISAASTVNSLLPC